MPGNSGHNVAPKMRTTTVIAMRIIHCIVAAAMVCAVGGALAQAARPASLRDAQRWQQLQGQADSLLAKGEFVQGEAVAREALAAAIAGFGVNDPNVAASHSSLGAFQLRNNNVGGAEASFRQALTIYEQGLGADHEFTAAMLNNLGLVLERRGDFAGAELLLRRALDVKEKRQGREHPDTAVTLANLARVLDRQGRSGRLAQSASPAAGGGAGAAGVPADADVRATQSAGAPSGDATQAEALHLQALAVHERQLGVDHPTTLATMTNLGNALMLQARFKEAEGLFRRVLAAREKVLGGAHPDTATSLNNVANALFEQIKQDDIGAPPARRLRGAAREFAQGSETESLYRRALAIQDRDGRASHPVTAATLNNLAVLLAGRGRFDEAVPLHQRALEIAGRALGPAHLDTASLMTTLAMTLDRQGRSIDAEALYAKAVGIAREAGVARNVLINASSMGYSLARRGRLRDALPYYREAVDALEALYAQASGLNQESRQAFLGRFAYVYRELMRILTALHGSSPGSGFDREALATASRSQSRVFSEMLRQADVARFSDNPAFAALKDRREALQEQIGSLRVAAMSLVESAAGAADHRADLARRLGQAQEGLVTAERDMWRDYPRYMELANPRPVTVDELQQKLLKPDEALLSYVFLQNEAVVFALTPTRFRMVTVKVSRDDIDRRVSLIRRPMERVAQGDPLTVLRQVDPAVLAGLFRDLIAPVSDTLTGARQVLVVADAALYALPLELLVTSWSDAERVRFDAARAASDGSADNPFLGEYATLAFASRNHRFTYLPSLAALASQRGKPDRPVSFGRELVAFGDAVFGTEPGEPAGYSPRTRALLGALAGLAPDGTPHIPRLPETALEARGAAALFGESSSLVLTRRDAQEKRAKSGLLKDARYVLFATHGFLGSDFLQHLDYTTDAEGARAGGANRGVLAQPALALTLTGDLQGEDGLLSMKEVIENVQLSADLVILSACNTAGDSRSGNNGEGFAGLARAFMFAGARRLMVSHWAVESHATQALVTGTFSELKTGRAATDALAVARDALATTRFSAAGRNFSRSHPFFWAPFVVVGD